MPKTNTIPLPDWLRPLLKRAIRGEHSPVDDDYEIAAAAVAGVGLSDLKQRFGLESDLILCAIKRVACAVRDRAVPDDVLEQYPDLESLASKRGGKNAKPAAKLQKIEPVDMVDCGHLLTSDPESLPEFLRTVKHESARRLAPATMAALEYNVRIGDQSAINKSLELLWGVGKRGPGTAVQVNVGGEKSSVSGPHQFEEIILSAEREEGAQGGETTVFDERLLGQQEGEG